MKTFFIKTLGCKVNQCDSQEIRENFLRLGWRESFQDREADTLVVNTCCVTAQADRKSRRAIREVIRRNPAARIAVTGCYVNYDRSAIDEINGVDAVCSKDELEGWIRQGREGRSVSDERIVPGFGGHTRAFLKIQEGCDNGCSYCIVPFVRGRSRSKPLSQVVEEAKNMASGGYKEIVLTGVCLGSYGRDLEPAQDLADAIAELEKISGLFRIRLSSVEASDVSTRLIDKMAVSSKLCPHLHIPFQSGDDEVLSAMNKRMKVADYQRIVQRARSKIRDLSITCDFIVGFPAEKEENFRNTLAFLETVKPLRTHLFTFSPRKGAAISLQKGQLSFKAAKDRYIRMQKLAESVSAKFKRSFVGKTLEVLFEEKNTVEWKGYGQNYIKVYVESKKGLKNSLSTVKIEKVNKEGVYGHMLQ